jgi:hypothetical protein
MLAALLDPNCFVDTWVINQSYINHGNAERNEQKIDVDSKGYCPMQMPM